MKIQSAVDTKTIITRILKVDIPEMMMIEKIHEIKKKLASGELTKKMAKKITKIAEVTAVMRKGIQLSEV